MMPLSPVILRQSSVQGPEMPVLVRWDRLTGSGVADAAGGVKVELSAPPLDRWYLVDRLVVQSESVAVSEAEVYVGLPSSPLALADFTLAGNADVSEYSRGLYVPGGTPIVVVWSGATVGARCWVTAQVALMAVAG